MAHCEHPNIAEIKSVYFNPQKINNEYKITII